MKQRKPMSRGKGFASRAPARQDRDPDRVRVTPTPRPEFRLAQPCGAPVAPIEKGPPAKAGKGAPDAEERQWMDDIVAYGCIACRLDGHEPRPTAVHHILRGGVRMGHLFTLPLCDPGHHQGGAEFALISRHPWKTQFEERYGSEMDLLDELRALLRP